MSREIDKVMRMVDQLGTYLLRSCQTESLSVSVKRSPEGYRISMECPVKETETGKIDALRAGLSQARKPELEDYYWQLAGDPLNPNALAMVSIMCDRIDLDYRDGTLTVEMVRLSAN